MSHDEFPTEQPAVVTCGLPYANGDLHVGHLRGYVGADVLNRALRKLGQNTAYVCGSDMHGTPIAVNAAKEGVSPEAFAIGWHEQYEETFPKFDVEFDSYGHTHDETNTALIFDEVQTGMGRTGALWNSQRAAVTPDMITSAKGLGNGFPVGATLCRDWIAEDYGSHASTFSGGPVISAAAGATVTTLLEDDVPENAAGMGDYLQTELAAAIGDEVRDIRGEGLMIGVEVGRGANKALKQLALNHGILALPAGRTVVRLLPPLTIDEEHADHVVEAMTEVVG